MLVARTEALIDGLGVNEALRRCHAYAAAGADAVLIHSKASTNDEVRAFLREWDGRAPVVIVPTTYPDWKAEEAAKDGVSVVIYANQGLRATVSALWSTFTSIIESDDTTAVEGTIAPVKDVFALQELPAWQSLEDV